MTDENLEELREHLKQSFSLVSALSVSGDTVDIVAGIREHLRKAYALTNSESG